MDCRAAILSALMLATPALANCHGAGGCNAEVPANVTHMELEPTNTLAACDTTYTSTTTMLMRNGNRCPCPTQVEVSIPVAMVPADGAIWLDLPQAPLSANPDTADPVVACTSTVTTTMVMDLTCPCPTAYLTRVGSQLPLSPSSAVPVPAKAKAVPRNDGNPVPQIVGSSNRYGYRGCFNETTDLPGTTHTRALDGPSLSDCNMTVPMCASFCADKGKNDKGTEYKYAGLEYSRECWCANELSSLSQPFYRASCDLPCAGDNTTVCGGNLKLSVYEFNAEPAGNTSYLPGTVPDFTSNASLAAVTGVTMFAMVAGLLASL